MAARNKATETNSTQGDTPVAKKRTGATKAQLGAKGAAVAHGISQEQTRLFERKVTDLRNAGASWPNISDITGRAESTCYEAYQRVLRSVMTRETRQEHVVAAVERANRLRLSVWQQALTGDVPSVRAVLEIDKRLASLLGLDAPVEVHTTTTWTPEALIVKIDEVVARRAITTVSL